MLAINRCVLSYLPFRRREFYPKRVGACFIGETKGEGVSITVTNYIYEKEIELWFINKRGQ